MGKRKRSNPEDLDDYLEWKVRKLEEKLERSRRSRRRSKKHRRERSKSTESDGSFDSQSENRDERGTEPEENQKEKSLPPNETEPPLVQEVPPDSQVPPQEGEVIEPPATDSLILQLLGDDPSTAQSYGKEIQPDLAVRLQHIATSGLSKEMRKELMEKYLPPSNCTLINAPIMNPEIKAAVSEAILKRDRGIEAKQKQLSGAISCLGEALTILLSSDNKDTALINLLLDASRIICDSQYNDSQIRRNFVFYNLKKDMKDQLQTTKIDSLLFGQDLAESLKVAKAISKTGAELKTTPAARPPTSKNKGPQKNWKAPPQSRRPKGTPRERKELPANKNSHTSSSKQSSRQPPSRSRR